jgi:hypothetical protein
MIAVRWYLRYALSYRDVEELLAERDIEVDHVTIAGCNGSPRCLSTPRGRVGTPTVTSGLYVRQSRGPLDLPISGDRPIRPDHRRPRRGETGSGHLPPVLHPSTRAGSATVTATATAHTRPETARSAQVISDGHAFVQNLRATTNLPPCQSPVSTHNRLRRARTRRLIWARPAVTSCALATKATELSDTVEVQVPRDTIP